MRALVLGLCLSACGLKYARAPEPVVLPGSPCRLLAGQDDWQYPVREVKPPPVEGLPEDVQACLMAGLSAEKTTGPQLQRALESRLRGVGYLDARVDDALVVTLGE